MPRALPSTPLAPSPYGRPAAPPRFGVLGPLRATGADGTAVPLRGRVQRRLLAMLLRHAPHAVPAVRLRDWLWEGEPPPADADAALLTQISRLRRSTGGDVARDGAGYRLTVAPDAIDAARFDALFDAARARPSPDEALADLDAALALWRGAPFDELADDPAFAAEAARLAERRADAIEHRAALLLTLGRADEALAAAQALAAEDPLRERPHALAMEALSRLDRRADALAVFQRYRRRLAEELGLEPSAALRDLEVDIIRAERAMTGAARRDAVPNEAAVAPAAPALRVTFLTGPRGARLAVGTVPSPAAAPLVVLPTWCSHLGGISGGSDPRAPFLAALARHAGLVVYDRAGTGLSGGALSATVDEDVAELSAVLDACVEGPVPLLAMSQSAATALTLAAREPRRVARLVLLGAFAAADDAFPVPALRESLLALVRAHWGMGSRVLARLFFPDAEGEAAERFARAQRQATTPDVAARALARAFDTDVRAVLPHVAQPVLVLHYVDDQAVPFAGARALAAGLPGAALRPLAGRQHIPGPADAESVARTIADFLRGAPPA